MTHLLRSPSSPEDWNAYHAIRRQVLFEQRGQLNTYDADHPDEHRDGNYPKILVVDDKVVGVIRVDLAPPEATFRRVAVHPDHQLRGYGTILLRLAEDFTREQGCAQIVSSVAPDAVGFYLKCGFQLSDTDPKGNGAVSMFKRLNPDQAVTSTQKSR